MRPSPPSGTSSARLWSRRSMLTTVGVAAAGLVASPALRRLVPTDPDVTSTPSAATTVDRHARFTVFEADPQVVALAAAVGDPYEFVSRLTGELSAVISAADPVACPSGPGIVLGLGPRLVAAIDPALPGATGLPVFRGDDAIPAPLRSGDLMMLVEADDPDVVAATAPVVDAQFTGMTASWSASGRRKGHRARNAFGFHDEVVMPTTADDIRDHVVLPTGPAAGGTLCAVRLLDLDIEGFASLPVEEREAAVGRHLNDGAPLSGDTIDDPVDLQARHPDGSYVIPTRSHVRAAHPIFSGSSLMLRRSYDVVDSDVVGMGSRQMLFTSYQRDIDTFVATQQRLDTSDDLMTFASPVASATFLMLPVDGASMAPWSMPTGCAH